MVMLELKVTEALGQMDELEVVTDAVAVVRLFICMVRLLADAVLEVLQVALLVITKPITSPLLKELEEYVDEFAPEMFEPLRVHWYAGEEPPLVMDEVKF